ncbi:MAG TPA: hypothetical protein DCE41_36890 [Cytophagales bacterium]|nr:hypothetical protein [Cytophagales bacterium]HAA23456.1 hypothetical protein [Cytophagales bacterium]HAP60668.1 hypothetical protein [Cytophagales bacterium]
MKRVQISLLSLWLALGASCTFEAITFEEIGITGEPLPYAVIVDGFISTLSAPVQVRLTQPVSVPDSIKSIPITEASLALYENGVLLSAFIAGEEPGLYQSVDSIAGLAGRAYTLEFEVDGIRYSATDTLPTPTTDFDFPAQIRRISDDGFLEFDLAEQNFGYETPSIWTWWEEEMIPFDIYRNERIRSIINHRGNIPAGVFPTSNRGTGISGFPDDALDIYKLDLSEAYYQYLLGRLYETDWQAGIFSTIPGNAPTNVEGGGGGFFWATSVSQWRIRLGELTE